MNKKTLSFTNTYLSKPETARKMRVRSLASSTAIETREAIDKIEAKIEANIINQHSSPHRVTLA